MQTLPTKTKPQSLPAKLPGPMAPAIEEALSFGLRALDDGSLHREVVPRGALVALQERRRDLLAALSPAPPASIALVLASLGNMATKTAPDPDEARALARQAVEDLEGVSLWALEAAARAFRRAEIGNGQWRPTPGQLRKEARRREDEPRAELFRIGRLLDAPALEKPKPVFIDRERFETLKDDIDGLGKAPAA